MRNHKGSFRTVSRSLLFVVEVVSYKRIAVIPVLNVERL